MKSIVLTLITSAFFSLMAKAQSYENSIGVRAGFYNGITFKHFLSDKAAFEGLLSSRWRGFRVTGLYEIHNSAFDTEGLQWFYGAGAHISSWNGKHVSWINDNNNYLVIGLDIILGLEYKFADAPINISLDWKPAINLIGYSSFVADGGALSIRYCF